MEDIGHGQARFARTDEQFDDDEDELEQGAPMGSESVGSSPKETPPLAARKRPLSAFVDAIAEDSGDYGEHEDPDLDDIFNDAGTDVHHRIRICRTYANYLAAKLRTKQRRRGQ